MLQATETTKGNIDDRTRSEAIVETLAKVQPRGETLTELAHDARNMVTALALYCELLEEPGVLSSGYKHYGHELRMIAEGSRHLLDRMLVLDRRLTTPAVSGRKSPPCIEAKRTPFRADVVYPADAKAAVILGPVLDLREELLANRNVLSALAGPNVALSIVACGGSLPVQMSGEELTRVLVNLVKNAAEAIGRVGAIRIGLGERMGKTGVTSAVILSVEDSGSGIPEADLERIFESGFSTRISAREVGWTARHRGLGLSITRSIVEAAGGRVHAENRSEGGARIEIELPIRTR